MSQLLGDSQNLARGRLWGSQDLVGLGGPGIWGVPGLAVLGGLGGVGESRELNQHLSQSILHCTSGGLSKGRKDGQAGKSFFWEGRAELG